MRRPLLILSTVIFYLLHQDFWNWTETRPLAFGFLPIGLWYHAGYTVATALLMCVYIRLAWPEHLEDIEAEAAAPDERR